MRRELSWPHYRLLLRVASCPTCNSSRENKGIFKWLGLKKKDDMHRLVAGKYLKELHGLHEAKETLDVSAGDLKERLCGGCGNAAACREWDTEGKLTCLCLESVF